MTTGLERLMMGTIVLLAIVLTFVGYQHYQNLQMLTTHCAAHTAADPCP